MVCVRERRRKNLASLALLRYLLLLLLLCVVCGYRLNLVFYFSSISYGS